ncbi:MAG TPA: hypothetical protein EYQ24_01040 [Bacteroidetes bacterium]|nr:hypothetical protein [Bacteroidota bacterium]
MLARTSAPSLLLGCALLAGCLPGSQRENTRALTPADSASTALAETVPVADLEAVWTTDLTERAPYPTGIAWLAADSAEARLAVVETQEGAVHLLSASGDVQERWEAEGEFPYLAGVVGDTVAVFARGSERIDWLTAAGAAASVPVPEGASAAFVDRTRTLVRIGGTLSEFPAALVELDGSGEETARFPLAVDWRASGYLRPWGSAVLSLSGYRPVVDVWTPRSPAGQTLDTLALTGFANPQLVRSYQFMLGEVDEPPLLTSAARALGDRLYVLNLRAERVRIDVYDREGQILRVLHGPVPTDPEDRPAVLDAYPADFDVRETPEGLAFAVLLRRDRGILQQAAARVTLFRLAEAPGVRADEAPADSAEA